MKYLLTLVLTAFFLLPSLNGQSQSKKETYTDYDRGYYLWYYNKWDSAYLVFNKYLRNPDDTLKKASAFKFMGEIQWYYGDLYDAQENLIEAIKTLDPENEKHHQELSYIYNVLGNISSDLKSYEKAVEYYSLAISFAPGTTFMYEIMNGKATAFQKEGKYNDAIAIYDSIMNTAPEDSALLARTIDNRANTKWLRDSLYDPLTEFWTALEIRKKIGNNQGSVISYGHLANYYTKSKPDSALWYANKMLVTAKATENAQYILDAQEKLIILNTSPELKEYWFREYKMLGDSLDFSRDTSRNRFAILKYDFQTIKEDNFSLKRLTDMLKVLTAVVAILSLIIIISQVISYRKRKKRIQQEAELSIRNSKLKTSQKVHDVVANELYAIMNELEHGKKIDLEALLNRIEELYERSRDISYEDVDNSNGEGYDLQVHSLLNSFTSDRTNVYVVGNQPEFWQRVTGFQKSELLLVLREIMTNMKKHSGASNVILRFAQENNTGCINYSDNGKGFMADITRGNGLSNTDNRIKSMNGTIIFGKSEQGGAAVAIRFPLEPYTL